MKLSQIAAAVLITAFFPLGTGAAAFAADNTTNAVPNITTTKAEVKKSGGLIVVDDGTNDNAILKNRYSKLRSTAKTSYNSDPDNLQYITEPKDQGYIGTCWAFSTTSCIETLLMKQDGAADSSDPKYDLSELHSALAIGCRFLQDGEYGFVNLDYDDGGVQEIYTMYTTRAEDTNFFNGPVEEEYMTYTDDPDEIEAITADDMNNCTTADYFPGSYADLHFSGDLSEDEINNRNTIIKELVNAYGSVSISISCGAYFENNYENFGETDEYTVFYQTSEETPDHAVTIVGYDDSFKAEIFEEAGFDKPDMDRAFLVKNSWGTDWGKNSGYFYMSYDSYLGYVYAYGNLMSRDSYDYEYDYTPFGSIGGLFVDVDSDGYDYGVFANNFEKQSEKKEKVNKVSVYVGSDDTDLQIYIDTDSVDGINNNMQPAAVKEADGIAYTVSEEGTCINVPYPGNYIFELEEPVEVEGDFTVAVYGKSLYGGPIAYESSADYDDGTPYLRHKAVDKSYVAYSVDDTFYKLSDIKNDDSVFMIRAYTEEAEDETVNVTIDGAVYETAAGTVLSDVLSAGSISETVYEAVSGENNSYKPADTSIELTEDITLYTGSYIYAPIIEMKNYQKADNEDIIRFVGEISDSFYDEVKEVTALGFVYSTDGGDVKTKVECGRELYSSLTNYSEQEGIYLFKSDELAAGSYIVSAYVSYRISGSDGEDEVRTVSTAERIINIS